MGYAQIPSEDEELAHKIIGAALRSDKSQPAAGRAARGIAGRACRGDRERSPARGRGRLFAEELLDGAGAALRTDGLFA
jgi:hypothetical protein